jgi:hypothetical protein
MKNFLLAIQDLFLFPQRMVGYSTLLEAYVSEYRIPKVKTDLPPHHPIPSIYIFLINLAFISTFAVVLFFSGFSTAKIAVIALIFLGLGFLLGSIHLSAGTILVLAGLLISTQNLRLERASEPTFPFWWAALPILLMPLGVYAQRLAHPDHGWYHKVWRLLLGITLSASSLYLVYRSAGTLTESHLIYSLAALFYVLAAPVAKESASHSDSARPQWDVINILGSGLFFLMGIAILWRWSNDWFSSSNVWIAVFLSLITVVIGGAICLALIAAPFSRQSQPTELNSYFESEMGWLFLLFYLSLQLILEPTRAFQGSIAGIILVALSYFSLNRLQEKILPVYRRVATIFGSVVWVYLIAGFLIDDTWRTIGLCLLVPDPMWPLFWIVFLVTAFSFSLFAVDRIVAAVVLSIMGLGIWFSNRYIPLPVNLFLIMLSTVAGFLLGMSKILVWPLLSFATFREARLITKVKYLYGDRKAAAIQLLELPSLIPPLGRKVLAQEMLKRGLYEHELDRPSSKRLFNQVQNRIARNYLETSFTIDDLVNNKYFVAAPSLKDAVELLRKAVQEDSPLYERTRAYTKALALLKDRTGNPRTGLSAITNRISGSQESAAAQRIADQVAIEVQPLAADFQDACDLYLGQVRSLLGKVEHYTVSDLRSQSAQEIEKLRQQQLRACVDLIDAINISDEGLLPWSDNEKAAIRALKDVQSSLAAMNAIRFDFPAQQRTIQAAIEQLKSVRSRIDAKFMIPSVMDGSIQTNEIDNVWATIIDQELELLKDTSHLTNLQIEVAKLSLIAIISEIDTLEKLAKIDRTLAPLSGLGESYAPLIDETIDRLEAIGREAASALSFPERGFSRRLGIQNTFERLSELRGLLSTRFFGESNEILGPLNQLSETIHQVLYSGFGDETAASSNPYQVGNPIQVTRYELFKGRLDLRDKIGVALRSRSTPTFVLHGPRRMGKTSFLLQLPRLLPEKFIPAFIDMQGGAAQTDGQFFYSLADALYSQVGRKLKVESPDASKFERQPYQAFTKWLKDLKPELQDRKVFFAIDEFETIGTRISEGVLSIQILEYLRHLMQHNEHVALLFAGVQTLEALGPHAASYFIGASLLEISYLSETEADELIRKPDPNAGNMPEYSKAVVKEIIRITKCQPYLIQAVCSEIYFIANEKSIKRITMKILREAVQRTLSTDTNYFQFIWDDAGKTGQKTLLKICSNSKPKLTRLESSALNELVKRHVVQALGNQEYAVEIPIMEMWLRNRYLD